MGDPRQLGRGGPVATAGGSLVLLSGGLDSAVCASLAARQGDLRVALSFDYGQRHRVELERAAALAAHHRLQHLVVTLDTRPWGGSSLTDEALPVPEPGGDDGAAIPSTYVPARNLIFLSVAVGVAEARDLDEVWIGINALDYSGYPDCRPEFVQAFSAAAAFALKRGVEGRPVEVRTPLVTLTKAEIVRLGLSLGAPLALTWSCYRGGTAPCGACDACHLRAKGFAEAGAPDPALA